MELCDKGNLDTLHRDLVKSGESFPPSTLWGILGDIATGIAHIHSKNFAHLDIKPQNVFISGDGVLKIGDFGLATEYGIVEDGLEGDQVRAPVAEFSSVLND
jgi:serine/threonine protein kinase